PETRGVEQPRARGTADCSREQASVVDDGLQLFGDAAQSIADGATVDERDPPGHATGELSGAVTPSQKSDHAQPEQGEQRRAESRGERVQRPETVQGNGDDETDPQQQ